MTPPGPMHASVGPAPQSSRPWIHPSPQSESARESERESERFRERGFTTTGQEFHNSTPVVSNSSTAPCSSGVHSADSPPNSFS